MEVPKLGVELELPAYTTARSKLRLWPTPQLMATPDPYATEWGQGLNPQLHEY